MPFYEYECTSCKFYTEVMQKITDAPLKKCPSCGRSTLKKLVSAPNFRLKGGGWYETDFKSDKEEKRNLAQAEKSEEKETKPAGETKTEAKPAEAKTGEAKAGEAKARESKAGGSRAGEAEPGKAKPATESRTRKSVSISRRTSAPQRAAKPKSTRPSARAKARPVRKARR